MLITLQMSEIDIRLAGNNEHRCIIRDALGFYGSVVVVGEYSLNTDLSNVSLHDQVVKALKHCVHAHPTLACTVNGSLTERPRLSRKPRIDLSDQISYHDIDAASEPEKDVVLEKLIHLAHSTPHVQPETRPQWRIHVQLLPSTPPRMYVAFSYSHSLLDGRSGLFFHKAFLQGLNAIPETLTAVETTQIEPAAQTAIPPAMENSTRLSVSWSFLLGPLIREYLPQLVLRIFKLESEPSESSWRGAATRPALPKPHTLIDTSLVTGRLSADTMTRILQRCRQKQVKLTSLLAHFTSLALSAVLDKYGQSYRHFHVNTAIDLRGCLRAAQNDIACYPSTVVEDITTDPNTDELDWAAMQRSTELLARKANDPRDQPVTLLRYLSDYKAWTTKRAKQPATGSFEISNLGAFDGASMGGAWRISDTVFSQSADATGDPFSVNVVSVKGGALNVVMTWLPGMLGVENEDAFMRDLCDRLIAELSRLA